MKLTIHLITKDGPEWQEPIEAWVQKKRAEARAKELDGLLGPGVTDRLSQHGVTTIILKGLTK